ncbi:MAG: hypothetical protein JSS04_09990 [Proteobacteria bacterium]|nr:hypothetical protein [Pseudomonadota bacterium]
MTYAGIVGGLGIDAAVHYCERIRTRGVVPDLAICLDVARLHIDSIAEALAA